MNALPELAPQVGQLLRCAAQVAGAACGHGTPGCARTPVDDGARWMFDGLLEFDRIGRALVNQDAVALADACDRLLLRYRPNLAAGMLLAPAQQQSLHALAGAVAVLEALRTKALHVGAKGRPV